MFSSFSLQRLIDAIEYASLLSLACFILLFLTNVIAAFGKRKTKYVDKPDDFMRKYGYSYDYVLVFKVYAENELRYLNEMQQNFTMKSILDSCQAALIETKCFYSCQRDEIYVKLRVHPPRLKLEADRTDYKLLLDPTNLKGEYTYVDFGMQVFTPYVCM